MREKPDEEQSWANLGIKEGGRLSTQKKSMSSRARKAVVFPAPDKPAIITNSFILKSTTSAGNLLFREGKPFFEIHKTNNEPINQSFYSFLKGIFQIKKMLYISTNLSDFQAENLTEYR
jgi:hypothetical protein